MNNFMLWIEKGKYTPTSHAFGVGRCCLKAIYSYKKGTPVLECGNMEKEHIQRENEARERAQREEEERKRKVAEMASKIVF